MMPTDDQIALMCDVGQAIPDVSDDLRQLIAEGFVEPDASKPSHYKLTAKGQNFLSERGAGLNEA